MEGQLKVKLYSTIGPQIHVEPYVELRADLRAQSVVRNGRRRSAHLVTMGLYAGLDINFAFKSRVMGKFINYGPKKIYEYRKKLASRTITSYNGRDFDEGEKENLNFDSDFLEHEARERLYNACMKDYDKHLNEYLNKLVKNLHPKLRAAAKRRLKNKFKSKKQFCTELSGYDENYKSEKPAGYTSEAKLQNDYLKCLSKMPSGVPFDVKAYCRKQTGYTGK